MNVSSETPRPDLSVVVPFYREEEVAESVVKELRMVLGDLDGSYELILVDDGSPDTTFDRILRGIAGDPCCTALRLARNAGQTAAMAAGFEQARGQVVGTMDGDLQNDPADVPALLERLGQGFDVVAGWRKTRQDGFVLRRLPSIVANRPNQRAIKSS